MKRFLPVGVILGLFTGVLFIRIGSPFLRHHESVNAQYATMARNQVRLGYAATRLGLYGVSAPDEKVYPDWRIYGYPNRPPLSVFVTSVWFHLLGDGEWVLRLSLIVVALGTLVSFAALMRSLLDGRWAWVAVAACAFIPIFWYFSIVAVHLAYSLCFSMAAWACWVRWDQGRRFRTLSLLFLFFACESDWPGYFATFSIAVDAVLSRRPRWAAGVLALGVGCFALHLAHLYWLDPEKGPLIRLFLRGGWDRSAQWRPGLIDYVKSEAREVGLYFTLGGVALAIAGLRHLPRRGWLLALLGLDEVVFSGWAMEHDYLTYSLAPFFAVAAAKGVEVLWRSRRGRFLAGGLLGLAVAQSAWITGDRLIRQGAFESNYRAGLAIRQGTRPMDRVLITIADDRLFTPYYADRYTAGVEREGADLVVHYGRPGRPVKRIEDVEQYFGDFSMVLVGDPESAAREIRFFKGARPPEAFRFLAPDHPLRRRLEELAISKETRGAFILYRLR
jgi:hypothetical protein